MTDRETAALVEDYRKVLRKVGLVLIVVGLLDIGWMAYCITRWWSYSSPFNIVAVIAGILLVRGSLPTARVAALFSAFFLTGSIGMALAFPIIMRLPLAFAWLCLRLHPLVTASLILLFLALLVVLAWTYRMLTKPAVLAAMDQQQTDHRRWRSRPSSGFITGALLPVILAVSLGGAVRSGTVAQAEAEAKKQVGPGYRFFISSLNTSSGFGGPTAVSATVVAYSDHEIRTVPVEFAK